MNPRNMTLTAVCVALMLTLFVQDASAWGTTAQKAITTTAIQLVRREIPAAFKGSEGANALAYDADVLRGAKDGPTVLREYAEVNGDSGVLNFIGTEIQLLREVSRFGMGSYFCYRMGVLSTLVSDAVLPYALDRSEAGKRIHRKMAADIDEHVASYTYDTGDGVERVYVRNPNAYIVKRRLFYDDAKTIIKGDYTTGPGYDGYLKKGAQAFFEEAVRGVSDVWYTVLRQKGDRSDVPPSRAALTWYLVDEIDYLLTVKRSQADADRAYGNLVDVNPGIQEAFEAVGDSFYEFGAKERAVFEWQVAAKMSGSARPRLLGKLAEHYYQEGKAMFDMVGKPEAPKTALDDALRNLQLSFEYNARNKKVEELIGEVKIAIDKREERRAFAAEQVAKAQAAQGEAQASLDAKAYADAMAKFNAAMTTFSLVDDEFDKYHELALAGIDACKQGNNKIISSLVEDAHSAIDKGDVELGNDNFDEATNYYKSVPSILSVLKDDPDALYLETKKTLLEEAEAKVKDVARAKESYERRRAAEQRRQEQINAANQAQQNQGPQTAPPAPPSE